MNTVSLTKNSRRWLAAFAIAALLTVSAMNSPFFAANDAIGAGAMDAIAGVPVSGLSVG